MIDRPRDLFDREREWADLAAFVSRAHSGVSLGVVYGRRRQGKSYLLQRLVKKTGGLLHQALEETRTAALARLGSMLGTRHTAGARLELRDWAEAIGALMALPAGARGRRVVVVDELPYLLQHSPELPSALQQAIDAAPRSRREGTAIVVCGSAVSIMSSLLEGSRALHGRARLELVVRPFDFRQARAFWKIRDLEVAFVLHAILGGTPGYRDLLPRPPSSLRGLGRWLAAGVLNPAHALYREADYLLAEDPRVTDRALYHSVLDAVSRGERAPTRIAARLGRSEGALRHPLRLLEEAELLHRTDDVLRERSPLLTVADPIVRFQHLVARPRLAELEERRGAAVWAAAQDVVSASILGPHFEHLARVWTARHASERTLGGPVGEVGPTTVSDPAARSQTELDVVALAAGERRQARGAEVRLLGEAKASSRPRGVPDLHRLERARALIAASGRADVSRARLALFARAGFSPELRRLAAERRDLELVDLERLYDGD